MSKDFDIAVIGSGIAGLTAALTAARLGRSTLILTGETLGGHLLNIEKIDGVPGYPDGVAGFDLCPITQEQAVAAGAAIAMASVTALERSADSWQLTTTKDSVQARAVIVASGTQLKQLDVPGESLLRGKGVSQCASCDAPLLRDKAVVVAGGGDSALQEALVLAEHAASVSIVHHEDQYVAQAAYRVLAEVHPRISALPHSEIVEISGDPVVDNVIVRNTRNGETQPLNCAAVFVFVGLQPNISFVDASVVDSDGAIITDEHFRTKLTGLLAAGTVRATCAGRAATAAGEGAAAALAADRFLTDKEWPTN